MIGREIGVEARKLLALAAMTAALAISCMAQRVLDRSVATITDGVRTELITYSDLLWQLALQPGTQLDPATSDDLNRALQLLINQRLFALEAERIPRSAPTDKEISDEISNVVSRFRSAAEFEQRLKRVGFSSVKDDDFEQIISERLSIEKYLDFRFRSFIVITPADEERYYNTVFAVDFRRRFPGVVVPGLEEKRAEIRSILTEERVAEQIEAFLDEAKRRVEIVILTQV
jgi:hypothetical protein